MMYNGWTPPTEFELMSVEERTAKLRQAFIDSAAHEDTGVKLAYRHCGVEGAWLWMRTTQEYRDQAMQDGDAYEEEMSDHYDLLDTQAMAVP